MSRRGCFIIAGIVTVLIACLGIIVLLSVTLLFPLVLNQASSIARVAPDCATYSSQPATATAAVSPVATPAEIPEELTPADAVEALAYDTCRWDAAGATVAVPKGWTVEVLSRIDAQSTVPGDLGAVRMNGAGELEELTVTIWARSDSLVQSADVLYPNPWIALQTLYQAEPEAIGESSLAGRRTARATGESNRRSVSTESYLADGKAWTFGGSSSITTTDAIAPLLEQLAARLVATPSVPAPNGSPTPAAKTTPAPAK